ncbi:MAG TPA: phosphatidylserine decarboxylase [Micromonosporaceae bacterium]|nr:phosphatidylserine decarboxylase [Micromonosporaceae bacterium]
MSLSPAGVTAAARSRSDLRLSNRAVSALTTELSRLAGPKTGLVVGVAPDSPVLIAALASLMPDDRLIFVAADGAAAEVRTIVADRGGWVAERVRVVDTLGDDVAVTDDAAAAVANDAAERRADVAILADPLTGTAEHARAVIGRVRAHLADGGVVCVATLAVPRMADGATEELGRQTSFYGVGTDVVVRNRPPLRIHRLRFTAAPAEVAERLRPAVRPSSIPLTRGMNVDANGVAAAGIALGLAAAARLAGRRGRWSVVPALAALPLAAFFRDPEREVPEDPAAVVASADGKVLSVERVVDKRFADDEMLRIAVFLSVLDVHINRAPVAGRVADFFVEDGGFAAAMSPAAEHNVAAYTVLDTVHGPVVIAQRTGLLARRIVQRAPIGAMLAKGERFGLIRFGSRTDVYLPASAAEPVVAPHDKVRGGTTVIARWHD